VAPTSFAGQLEQPYGPRVAGPAGRPGAADLGSIAVFALHEDLWHNARAIGDGLGRAARMGREKPARHPQEPITPSKTWLTRG